jgi:acyl-coenzyme A thioesterase PaaI-like protein
VSAGLTLFPPGTAAATADYTAKFLAEARGDALTARARVLRAGALTVSSVEEERLCATALVTARVFGRPRS